MFRIVIRLRRAVHSLGWTNGCVSVLAEGATRLSRGTFRLVRYRLLVQPIEPTRQLAGRRGQNLFIREADWGDPVFAQMDRPQSTIRARFEQGAHCLVALRNDELVGFLWWIEGAYREDEVRCLFVPWPVDRAVWDFDVYVAPESRLSPVFARLWERANQCIAARGYSVSCSRISAFNSTSLQAHKRLGAIVVGSRSYFCLGGLELSFSAQRPRIYLSVSPDRVPTVTVPPEGYPSEAVKR